MPATFLKSIVALKTSFAIPNSTTGLAGGATSIDTTGATLLVAFTAGGNSGTPTMVDSASNTWASGPEFSQGAANPAVNFHYVFNPITSTTHTFDPEHTAGSCVVFAFSGAGIWALDQMVGATTQTSGTTVTTGSVTPSQVGDVIIGGIGSFASIGPGSVNNGFTGGQGVAAGSALSQRLSGSPCPSLAGYLIDSASSSINVTFSSVPSNADWIWAIAAFKLTPTVFNISGNAGVAGATVSWSGLASGSTVADGSGNYTIPNLANGSYTITPSLATYTFSPTSSSQTVAGANITGVNFIATQQVTAVPTFSPVAGAYSSPQSVTILDSTPGSSIFYTIDGSIPTTGSTPFTAPIVVGSTEMIRAIASAPGFVNSGIASATYVITIPPLNYSSKDSRSFPNNFRIVQGTLTYDVPSFFSLKWWFDILFNRTQPLPEDSRASKPVDCRVSPNIPINSRTPGTFGPGV
jgi:hypothetical protein